jgi:hypothetical protein
VVAVVLALIVLLLLVVLVPAGRDEHEGRDLCTTYADLRTETDRLDAHDPAGATVEELRTGIADLGLALERLRSADEEGRYADPIEAYAQSLDALAEALVDLDGDEPLAGLTELRQDLKDDATDRSAQLAAQLASICPPPR